MEFAGKKHPEVSQRLACKRHIIAALIVFALSGAYFLSYCNYDYNYWDEGVPLNGALRMFRGERPVRDFLAYPPGRYLIYFMSMTIGGIHVSSPRIVMSLLTALMAVFIWFLSIRVGLKRTAWIPCLLFLLMPMYYYYRFFTISLILMALCLECVLKPSPAKAIWAGFLAVAVVWLRFELGLFLLFMLLLFPFIAALKCKRKPSFFSFLPLLIMVAGNAGLIVYIGGFQVWCEYFGVFTSIAAGGFRNMSLPWPPLWSPAYLQSHGLFYLFRDFQFYVAAGIILGAAAALVKNKCENPALTAVFTAGTVGFGLVIWRSGFGNLIRVHPPLAILGVYLLTRKTRFFQLQAALGVLLLTGLAVDSLFVGPVVYQSTGVKNKTFWAQFAHPRFNVRLKPVDCGELSLVISALENLKRQGYSTLLTVPFHPVLNFVSDMPNNSYYEWLLPGMFNDWKAYSGMLENVISSDPDVVVVNDVPFDGKETRRFSSQYPELMEWILADYVLKDRISVFNVFTRKNLSAESLLKMPSLDITDVRGAVVVKEMEQNRMRRSILIQECCSSIAFRGSSRKGTMFYSAFRIQSDTTGSGSVYPEVEINGMPVHDAVMDITSEYSIISFVLPETDDELLQIDLGAVCAEGCSNGKIWWLDPVLVDIAHSSLFIDKYCSIP